MHALADDVTRCSGEDIRKARACPERETCERWRQRDTGTISNHMLCFGDRGYFYKIAVRNEP